MPGDSKDGDIEIMQSVRRVMRYGNCTFEEAMKLPTDVFLLMSKNMLIEDLQKTESGRKYLADCERMQKTEPDVEKLHRVFGR